MKVFHFVLYNVNAKKKKTIVSRKGDCDMLTTDHGPTYFNKGQF